MSRKPQGESEKPQGPATTAGAPGYKGAPTLKNRGWGTRKSKKQIPRSHPNTRGSACWGPAYSG